MVPRIQKMIVNKKRDDNDPLLVSLQSLSQDDIDKLLEVNEMQEAGFSDIDIEGMLKEGFEVYLAAKERLIAKYDSLLKEKYRKDRI